MESQSKSSTLHRRYSVGTPPSDLFLPKISSFLPPSVVTDTIPSPSHSSSSSMLSFKFVVDLELISLDSQTYTSLKDILPTTSVVNSPTTAGPSSSSAAAYDIQIRNGLVKQAVWVYMQPMAASPPPTHPLFSHVMPPLNAFCRLFNCGLIRMLNRAFQPLSDPPPHQHHQ